MKTIVSLVLSISLLLPSTALAVSSGEPEIMQNSIQSIEDELEKEGTNVKAELENLMSYYQSQLTLESLEEEKKEQINELIEGLERQVANYDEYKGGVDDFDEKGNYHPVYSAAIGAVNAFFVARGYFLASELLTHAANNNRLNSVYRPVNGHRVLISPVFTRIKHGNGKQGSAFFPNSGNPVQRDLYYAIHNFNWKKSGRSVTLSDRYDYTDNGYSGIEGFAVNTMYYAQQMGVIVPYYVRITQ